MSRHNNKWNKGFTSDREQKLLLLEKEIQVIKSLISLSKSISWYKKIIMGGLAHVLERMCVQKFL